MKPAPVIINVRLTIVVGTHGCNVNIRQFHYTCLRTCHVGYQVCDIFLVSLHNVRTMRHQIHAYTEQNGILISWLRKMQFIYPTPLSTLRRKLAHCTGDLLTVRLLIYHGSLNNPCVSFNSLTKTLKYLYVYASHDNSVGINIHPARMQILYQNIKR